MNAETYIGQNATITCRRTRKNGKDDKNRETLFGLVMALTTMYTIGALVVFVASLIAR